MDCFDLPKISPPYSFPNRFLDGRAAARPLDANPRPIYNTPEINRISREKRRKPRSGDMSENTDATIQSAIADAARADAPASGERLRHLLVKGDALNPNALDGESVDLIVTSPPYNVGKPYTGDSEDDAMGFDDFLEFTRQWLGSRCAWTKPTGRICVNVSIDKNKNGKMPLSAHLTLAALRVGWKYHATILWNEGNISRRAAWGSRRSASAAARGRAGGDDHRSLQGRVEARTAGAQRHYGGRV